METSSVNYVKHCKIANEDYPFDLKYFLIKCFQFIKFMGMYGLDIKISVISVNKVISLSYNLSIHYVHIDDFRKKSKMAYKYQII